MQQLLKLQTLDSRLHPGSKSGVTSASDDGDEETIEDPENPGLSGLSDVFQGGDEESIFDPSRPAESSGDARPKPPSSSPQPSAASTNFGRIGFVTGTFESRAAVDTAFEGNSEDVFEWRNTFGLALRYDPSTSVSARLTARFVHWYSGEKGTAAQDAFADTHSVFDVDLREANVRYDVGELRFTLGQQFVLWGATDVNKFGQLLHPRDYRYGVSLEGKDDLLPVFALDAKWFVDGETTLEGVLVPFYQGDEGQLFGNDFSLFNGGSPLIPGAQVASLLDGLVREGYGESLRAAVDHSGNPEASLDNLSAGVHLSRSVRGVDLSLGYLYGWDQTPSFSVDADLNTVIRAVLLHPEVLDSFDPMAILLEPGVVAALLRMDGKSPGDLVEMGRERQHALEFDLETYAGPIGIRTDWAFRPNRTVLTQEPTTPVVGPFEVQTSQQVTTHRYGSVDAALGFSWESDDTNHVLILEGTYQHLFGVRAPVRPLLFRKNSYGLSLAWRSKFFEVLELAAGGQWNLDIRKELIALAGATYDFGDGVSAFAQYTLFEGPSVSEELTVGGLYDHNDNVLLGGEWVF